MSAAGQLSAGFSVRRRRGSSGLELEGQIHLEQMELGDGIDLRNILAAATGAQLVVDARCVTISDCADKIISETVGDGAVDAFQIGAPFKNVLIEKIGIERILLDMLPVGLNFPRMLAGCASPKIVLLSDAPLAVWSEKSADHRPPAQAGLEKAERQQIEMTVFTCRHQRKRASREVELFLYRLAHIQRHLFHQRPDLFAGPVFAENQPQQQRYPLIEEAPDTCQKG